MKLITAALLQTHTNTITTNSELVSKINELCPPLVYTTLKQKIYHIVHSLEHIPTCFRPNCNNLVKWDKQNQMYTNACGYKCSNINPTKSLIQKRKKTNIKRYGGNAPVCSDVVKTKMKKTNIKRYGEDYTRVIGEMSKHATREKYGVDNISQLDAIKIKKIQNSKRKFGTNHPQQNTEIQQKTIKTLMTKYGVTNINRIHIPIKTLELLDDKDFVYNQHITHRRTASAISASLGISHECVRRAIASHNIQYVVYANQISVGEQQVFDFIKPLCPDAIQSDRSILGGKELDILIPSKNIAIEYCGLYWHSSAHTRITKMYHHDKMQMCKDKGIRLITLFENEWFGNTELIKTKLCNILKCDNTQSIAARTTKFIELDKQKAKEFTRKYHIQGTPKIISHAFGLCINTELVAVMMFTKRSQYMELVRYCANGRVLGGFSKLFKNATDIIQTPEYISFADLRWSNGDVYANNGWALDKVLAPDYKYIEGNNLVHKFNYRHNHLHKKLTNYNPLLSEYQNTINHHVYRVYDCGLVRFRYSTTIN
jgi:hypothetical protein